MRNEVMSWALLATLLLLTVVAIITDPGNAAGAPTPIPLPF